MKYCIYCGAPLAEGSTFCQRCGKYVKAATQQPVYSESPTAPRPARRQKKKRGCFGKAILLFIIFFVIIAALSYLGDSDLPEQLGQQGQQRQQKTETETGNVQTEVLTAPGFGISVGEGTFPEGATVQTVPASDEQLALLKRAGVLSRVTSPMNIGSEAYDGSFFATDVILTMPMARPAGEKEKNLGRYVFVCYDEALKQIRYLWPDRYDAKNNTISVRMPHFSLWSSGELTEEQEIENFLDSYCTKLAVEQGKQKKAASDLAPYVEAKAKALGLTKEAAKDLAQSAINILCGSVSPEATGIEDINVVTGSSARFTQNAIRAYWDDDASKLNDEFQSSVNTAMMWAWEGLKFSEQASKVFRSEYVREFVPGAIEKPLSNLGGIGAMAGRMCEGDFKGGMEELGNILQGIHPAAELATKGVKFLAEGSNMAFTYWKDNEVEELYQVYKNGARGLFGNYVDPCDRESFLEFLNYGSGFTKGKAVYRFYQMDKVAEVCERYGWSRTDYEGLDDRYKQIFNQRAEAGLMDYFELRRQQEAEAEKLKAVERRCIQEMLNPYYGVLRSDNYRRYFGEYSDEDFNISERLEKLVKVRTFISQFVDEKELARSSKIEGSFNYGSLLNEWVSLASRYKKDEAIKKFKEYLKSIDLLKKGLDEQPQPETYGMEDMKKIADFMSSFGYMVDRSAFKGCKFKYDERTHTGTITVIGNDGTKNVIKILNANTIQFPNGEKVTRQQNKQQDRSGTDPFNVQHGTGTKRVE